MEQTRDSIQDIWGQRTPFNEEWPIRLDQRMEQEPDQWVQSACLLCSNGCGMDIGVKDGRIVGVRGREVDAVNRGRLGPKGLHGWEANNSKDRLTKPLIRKNGKLEEGRISIHPIGEAQPAATNATSEGRQQNRRVEIVARGSGAGQ